MRLGVASLILLASAVAHAQPAPEWAPPAAAGSDAAAPPAVVDVPAPPPVAPRVPVTPDSPAAAVGTVKPDLAAPSGDDWSFRPGGFLQPEFRLRQQTPGAPDETDGFRLVRARITATGSGHVGGFAVGSYLEAELQPSFSLFDAYVSISHPLPHHIDVEVDAGQMRVPISRQQLISDTRRSWVESAQIASIAPDRDLGTKLTVSMPHVRAIVGSFDGEGRDQGQNVNNSFFTAGRLEVTPVGEQAPYAESAFAGPFLSFGVSVGYDKLTPGAYQQNETFLGFDVSGAWHGLSGEFEYLQVQNHFTDGTMLQPDYRANGFVAQVAYLLPIAVGPEHKARIEIGARVEEIDRNDVTPIIQIGDPNQSERIYTAVISYYLKQHNAKLQLAAYHFQEIETLTATGANAVYPNDELLMQLTYRVE